jgi:hypothetical protein
MLRVFVSLHDLRFNLVQSLFVNTSPLDLFLRSGLLKKSNLVVVCVVDLTKVIIGYEHGIIFLYRVDVEIKRVLALIEV